MIAAFCVLEAPPTNVVTDVCLAMPARFLGIVPHRLARLLPCFGKGIHRFVAVPRRFVTIPRRFVTVLRRFVRGDNHFSER